MINYLLAKIGVVAIASIATIVPLTVKHNLKDPTASEFDLIIEKMKQKECFLIPARSTFDSTKIKLLVCSEDNEVDYYLFDSEEDNKFLKISSLQWNPRNKNITVKLESESKDDYLADEDLWSEVFVATGSEGNDISKDSQDLLKLCSLSEEKGEKELKGSRLLLCGQGQSGIAGVKSKEIPLTLWTIK